MVKVLLLSVQYSTCVVSCAVNFFGAHELTVSKQQAFAVDTCNLLILNVSTISYHLYLEYFLTIHDIVTRQYFFKRKHH